MSRILHIEAKMDLSFDVPYNDIMSAAVPHQIEREGRPLLLDMMQEAIGEASDIEITDFQVVLEDRA